MFTFCETKKERFGCCTEIVHLYCSSHSKCALWNYVSHHASARHPPLTL